MCRGGEGGGGERGKGLGAGLHGQGMGNGDKEGENAEGVQGDSLSDGAGVGGRGEMFFGESRGRAAGLYFCCPRDHYRKINIAGPGGVALLAPPPP